MVVLKFRENAQKASHAPDPVRVMKLLQQRRDVQLLPPATLKLNLAAPGAPAAADQAASWPGLGPAGSTGRQDPAPGPARPEPARPGPAR